MFAHSGVCQVTPKRSMETIISQFEHENDASPEEAMGHAGWLCHAKRILCGDGCGFYKD